MLNRSNDDLPVFYTRHNDMIMGSGKPIIASIEINDFSYLHFHDCLEIGYCVSGKGICLVEDKQYAFKKGDVEIIFPFQKHLSRNSEKESSVWYWLTFNPHSLMKKSGFLAETKLEQAIYNEMGLCGIFSPEQYPEVVALVEQFFGELLEKDNASLYHSELCALYVYQLFIRLARVSEPLPKLKVRQNVKLQTISPALDIISHAVQKANTPSVETLASSCNMSVSNFRKVFFEVTGLSPKSYIMKCFINKAQQLLLTTDKSISEICIEAGFGDISWFNRKFLSETDMTPSAFRSKYSKRLAI